MDNNLSKIDINTVLVHRPLRHTEKMPSGRTYSRELLEQFVKDWSDGENTMFGTFNRAGERNEVYRIDLDRVATIIIDMYVDDEGLVVHQQLVDTPCGNLLLELMRNDLGFAVYPKVMGKVDADGNIYDAKLYGVYIDDESTPTVSDNE